MKGKKPKVGEASGWKVVGSGRNFIVKRHRQGDVMLIQFGGVHPIINRFNTNQEKHNFVSSLLTALGYSYSQQTGKGKRFYVGKK